LLLIALFGVRVFGSDSAEPFFPFSRAAGVLGAGLDVDEFGEAAALRAVLAGAAFGAAGFAEALEAAVLEFPVVVLDAVFLLPVAFDTVLPFFSAITPLP
jgi:hypothetical protein